MGRVKNVGSASQAHAQHTASFDEKPLAAACGICGENIDTTEEYLGVDCNTCGRSSHHMECAVTFLLARAKEKTNSSAISKQTVRVRKNPTHLFSQRVACPNGVYTLQKDGDRVPGSQTFRGKRQATGACPGFTQGAEVIKPAKEPPPPLPQLAPAPGPKKAAAAAAHASSSKPTSSAPNAAAAAKKPAAGIKVINKIGKQSADWTTVGAPKKNAWGMGAGVPSGRTTPNHSHPNTSRQHPAPDPHRPPHLQLCRNYLEYGECRIYNCGFSHSEEELEEREKEWAARREAKKRQAVAPAPAQRGTVLADPAPPPCPAPWAQALISGSYLDPNRNNTAQSPVPVPGPNNAPGHNTNNNHNITPSPTSAPSGGPQLSPAALSAMRDFKRCDCINSLLVMGFPLQQSEAAADAAAAQLEAAVQLLMDGGQACTGTPPPVDVSKEAAELLAAAAGLGVEIGAVEAELERTGGNWSMTRELLEQGGSLGSTVPEEFDSVAPSEPDTPSAALPPWAVDAGSSMSAHSPTCHSPVNTTLAAPGAGDAPSDLSAGLSLADFSSAEDLGGTAMFGVDVGVGVAGQAQEAAAGCWPAATGGLDLSHLQPADSGATFQPPTTTTATVAQQFGSPLPTPCDLPPAPAGTSATYDDGYAAGLAAATAMLQQQYGQQYDQQYGQQYNQHYSSAAGAQVWQPAPAAASPVAEVEQEEEIDELMHMLGIA